MRGYVETPRNRRFFDKLPHLLLTQIVLLLLRIDSNIRCHYVLRFQASGGKLMEGSQMLRVVVFQDSGQWVAQCLEYDICAHASDEETLRERFDAILNFERNLSIERNGAPFAGIDPAPEEFHDMWTRAEDGGRFDTPSGEVELKKCA